MFYKGSLVKTNLKCKKKNRRKMWNKAPTFLVDAVRFKQINN